MVRTSPVCVAVISAWGIAAQLGSETAPEIWALVSVWPHSCPVHVASESIRESGVLTKIIFLMITSSIGLFCAVALIEVTVLRLLCQESKRAKTH